MKKKLTTLIRLIMPTQFNTLKYLADYLTVFNTLYIDWL